MSATMDAERNFYIRELYLDLESWPKFYRIRLLFDRYFPWIDKSTVAFNHFYIYEGQADSYLLGAVEYFSAHMKNWSNNMHVVQCLC